MSLRLQAGDTTLEVAEGRIATLEGHPGRILTGDRIRLGSVCAHTHLYSGLVPFGMPAPEPAPQNFLEILQRVWWRLDRALDEDMIRASARVYVAEALLAGTTTLMDHHESPECIEGSLDILADVCEELGVRALLCYGATERNGGHAEARRGLAECGLFADRRTVRGLVGLHASFTVSDKTIEEARDVCIATGRVLHVHVAEDGADVEDAKQRGFPGPLERLERLGALPAGSLLAHGVHLDAAQVAKVQDLGCWLVQNPRSNRGNGVGYPQHLGVSARVALGTDGYPADMAVEADEGRTEAQAHGENPLVIDERLETGRRLVAERFGLPFEWDAGSAADLVVEEGGTVQHVIVDGEIVVRDGILQRGDLDTIRAEAQNQATRLWKRM